MNRTILACLVCLLIALVAASQDERPSFEGRFSYDLPPHAIVAKPVEVHHQMTWAKPEGRCREFKCKEWMDDHGGRYGDNIGEDFFQKLKRPKCSRIQCAHDYDSEFGFGKGPIVDLFECLKDKFIKPPEHHGCICQKIYAPVCGCDGRTYGNECEANCAGVKVCAKGECKHPPKCLCPEIFDPVCCDGTTYGNKCEAECKGAKNCKKGECQKPLCSCQMIYDPVCCDGTTYGNQCEADCKGAKNCRKGECKKPHCSCKTLVYDPVCCDGTTYPSQCEADCHGEKRCHKGECKRILPGHPNPACICPAVYAPVCGCDGRTYSNECEANCADAKVCSKGECKNHYTPPPHMYPTQVFPASHPGSSHQTGFVAYPAQNFDHRQMTPDFSYGYGMPGSTGAAFPGVPGVSVEPTVTLQRFGHINVPL